MKLLNERLSNLKNAMIEFESSYRQGYVPNNFLKILNISSDEFNHKSTTLESCNFLAKSKNLKLNFTKDIINPDLELLSANPFRIILKNSKFCYLEYKGPEYIIYRKSDHTYCPYDYSHSHLKLNSVPFMNCHFKNFSSLYHDYYVTECLNLSNILDKFNSGVV